MRGPSLREASERNGLIGVAALEAIGGAPREILYDRMKTAVLGEDAEGLIICKKWYPISRTVSEEVVHRVTRMMPRSAPSPSSPAPSARRYAALGLDRSARPRKRVDRAANAQL